MDPFFTVIIPTFNRAHMINKAINSVINQTFPDWELIIVDDGSTDNTREVIESYKEPRIRYVYQTNQERSVARNNGIRNAVGKYICFLDSDDYYLPQRLEFLHDEIFKQNSPIAMIYTDIYYEKDEVIEKRDRDEVTKENCPCVFDFVIGVMIGVPQTCISVEILKKHYFNPIFHIGEDMELWLRIVNEYPLIYFPDQFTVIAKEHEDRSVNVIRKNVYREVLMVFHFIKKNYKYPFSRKTIKFVYTDCYFGIARYYIYKKNKLMAFYNMFMSLIYDLKNPQFKYRLNILINIVINFTKAIKLINN